jgi:hypothetical protein
MAQSSPDVLPVDDVAALFGVHGWTVRRWVKQGFMPGRVEDGRLVVARSEVEALLEAEPLNDIEATGECCCAGCIGMGPCDDDLGTSDPDDRDDDDEDPGWEFG